MLADAIFGQREGRENGAPQDIHLKGCPPGSRQGALQGASEGAAQGFDRGPGVLWLARFDAAEHHFGEHGWPRLRHARSASQNRYHFLLLLAAFSDQ